MATASAHPSVRESISNATKKLGVATLKPQQHKALESFLRGHDVFLSLPTGFGKSVVFQGASLCVDYLKQVNVKDQDAPKNFAIVVMPLKALVKDQLERAAGLGIAAADLSGGLSDKLQEQLSRGKLSLLTTSPEFLTGEQGLDFLKLDFVQQRLCGFFIDESHCVTRWGQSSGKTQAFRECYGRLGELRSLLPAVPVVAMTATATRETRDKVAHSLCMRNFVTIIESPDKVNIKHVVLGTKEKDFEVSMKFLINELKSKGHECERAIVYCQSRRTVAELYAIFCAELRSSSCAGLVEMYHTNTEQDVQDRIICDMGDPDGKIRVLIATIAFGMGVDVKGVHTAIMLGRPTELDDYLQMAGRIGRDGNESLCVTVKYPGDVVGRRISKQMERFLKGTECRRGVILENYQTSDGAVLKKHECCDVCAEQCTCSGTKCGGELSRLESLARNSFTMKEEALELPVIIPTPAQQDKLQRCLEEYRNELVLECPDNLYSGKDIASGLQESTIAKILQETSVQLSRGQYMRRYNFGSSVVAQRTWEIYLMALERTEIHSSDDVGIPSPQNDSDGSDVWSGDEFADAIADFSLSESD